MKLDLENIYFSFADGVIDYKCAECTAFCCRGFGMQISVKRDLPLMSKHYPAVASLAFWREGDQLFLNTPVTGCTLLQGTYCGFEQELGKKHKPVGCTLFPFNNLFRVGNRLIVALHHICPLQLSLPPRPGEVQGTHRTIAATIRELGICKEDVMPSWVTPLQLRRGDSENVYFKREERFRNRCIQGLGCDRFLDILLEFSEDGKALGKFFERVSKLMGWKVKSTKVPDGIDDLLLTLAPTFRILESTRDPEHHLRSLGLLEIQARFAFASGVEPAQLKSIYGLFLQRRNAFRLLAFGDERLKPAQKNQVGLSVPQNLIARTAAIRRIPQDGVLFGLEKAFQLVMNSTDRATILNNLVEISWVRSK